MTTEDARDRVHKAMVRQDQAVKEKAVATQNLF